jgi:alpha-tubulin suppressor-like RCC1 family protein
VGTSAVEACSSFDSSAEAPDPSADATADACPTCGVDAGGEAGGGDAGAEAGDSVVAVRAGGQFACALRGSGAVSCWGRNDEGQTGQPPEGDLACDVSSRCRPTPLLVPGLTNVTHLASGQTFACARTADGAVLCWGSNTLGTLGMAGTQLPQRAKPGIVSMLPHALDVSAGAYNACARVDEDGGVEVYCWGTNRQGMLGAIPAVTTSLPTRIAALSGAKSVVLSRLTEHGCAILADDRVACWGANAAGSLGHAVNAAGDLACPNSTVCTHVPTLVGTPDFKAAELALGFAFGCARGVGTGEVKCWGYNGFGSLGLGGTWDTAEHPDPSATPVVMAATAISAGAAHACAIVDGALQCWGDNVLGELGNGNLSDPCGFGACKTTAQAVLGLTGVVVRLSTGFSSTFATTSDGRELSWGANPDGRLGHAPGASSDLLNCAGNKGRCNPSPQPFTIP